MAVACSPPAKCWPVCSNPPPDQHLELENYRDGNAALSVDVRLPEANTLERLLALGAEPAGQGNGQPDRNFCLVAHTRSLIATNVFRVFHVT